MANDLVHTRISTFDFGSCSPLCSPSPTLCRALPEVLSVAGDRRSQRLLCIARRGRSARPERGAWSSQECKEQRDATSRCIQARYCRLNTWRERVSFAVELHRSDEELTSAVAQNARKAPSRSASRERVHLRPRWRTQSSCRARRSVGALRRIVSDSAPFATVVARTSAVVTLETRGNKCTQSSYASSHRTPPHSNSPTRPAPRHQPRQRGCEPPVDTSHLLQRSASSSTAKERN